MALCREKKGYASRMAAEAALGVARNQWKRDQTRAPAPPVRAYRCEQCGQFHLTHLPLQ